MLIEAALILSIDTTIKFEIDQLELMKSKFQYNWWEEQPMPEYNDEREVEQLFRKLLETMEKRTLDQFNKVVERDYGGLV